MDLSVIINGIEYDTQRTKDALERVKPQDGTLEESIVAICGAFGLEWGSLRGWTKEPKTLNAQHVLIYTLANKHDLPPKEISDLVLRDYAAIVAAEQGVRVFARDIRLDIPWENPPGETTYKHHLVKAGLNAWQDKTDADGILKAICRTMGVKIAEVKEHRRNKHLTTARHVVYYVFHRLLEWSSPDTGRYLGNKHHTTVLAGVKRIEKYLLQHPIPLQPYDPSIVKLPFTSTPSLYSALDKVHDDATQAEKAAANNVLLYCRANELPLTISTPEDIVRLGKLYYTTVKYLVPKKTK